MNKNIVNGKASVCTWDLTFYFLDKTQVKKFIKLLLKEKIDFNFEYEYVLAEMEDRHYISITGSWANNLTRIGKLLENVDYGVNE